MNKSELHSEGKNMRRLALLQNHKMERSKLFEDFHSEYTLMQARHLKELAFLENPLDDEAQLNDTSVKRKLNEAEPGLDAEHKRLRRQIDQCEMIQIKPSRPDQLKSLRQSLPTPVQKLRRLLPKPTDKPSTASTATTAVPTDINSTTTKNTNEPKVKSGETSTDKKLKTAEEISVLGNQQKLAKQAAFKRMSSQLKKQKSSHQHQLISGNTLPQYTIPYAEKAVSDLECVLVVPAPAILSAAAVQTSPTTSAAVPESAAPQQEASNVPAMSSEQAGLVDLNEMSFSTQDLKLIENYWEQYGL